MDAVFMLGLIVIAMTAGLIGSLFGLGGGIIIVPVLTILYGMTAKDAAAVSLVAIVAISAVSASSLIKSRTANVRIGLKLETAAATGAIIGAIIALYVSSWVIAVSFAIVLIYSAIYMFMRPERVITPDDTSDSTPGNASDGTSDGNGVRDTADREERFTYHDTKTNEDIQYGVRNVRTGMIGFLAAGITSALSGVGGGTIKIPVMNVHMHIPMKAATATSSYVIGITAFSGAVVYLLGGILDIETAAVVVIGAFIGSLIGLRILTMIDASSMRRYFSILLIFLASVMLLNAGGFL
ncbi:MAG: sulfite exporter TauE/SafE family protein [Methanomassiliicoccaceae archaeon]|nr:sulfite exporter TauE/SafE family protein [Methanomassiliicoccaceae archaeon]